MDWRPGVARILVVDDSADLRRLFTDVLARDNHEIVEAVDGALGLTRLMAERFDIAILDVMMPHLDGLTLCRMLRDMPGLCELPIIIVSGASTEAAALSAGADAFLSKPFRPSKLLSIVKAFATAGRPRLRPADTVSDGQHHPSTLTARRR
jgi:DNA-binding response OmpR family regulator